MIKLVCIKDLPGKLIINNFYEGFLSKKCIGGYFYESYRIVDETGKHVYVKTEYFMSLAEWREQQMKNILDGN